MIPALLSCLFVLYLYRTLNEPSGEEVAEGAETSGSSVQSEINGLERELSMLGQRLANLAAAQPGEQKE